MVSIVNNPGLCPYGFPDRGCWRIFGLYEGIELCILATPLTIAFDWVNLIAILNHKELKINYFWFSEFTYNNLLGEPVQNKRAFGGFGLQDVFG